LLVLAGILAPACGSTGASAAPADGGAMTDATTVDAGPIPLADLCPVFTQDLCIYLMQCNHAPYRDRSHCEAELDCYGLPQLQMSAAAGGVIYDPGQVGACHARFLADPCGFAWFLFTPDIFEVLSYCPGTLTPLRKAGDPCVSTGECTQGLYCKKDAGCPGTCTPFGQIGASCAGTARCDPSLECQTVVTTAPDASTGTTSELCQAMPKAGDPCRGGDCGTTENCPADPAICAGAKNLWCDMASKACAPGAGAGSACGPTPGTPSSSVTCASDLWCDQVWPGQPGTCRTASGMGGPCNITGCSKGLHCAGYVGTGASATLGTCVGPSAAGGPCASSDDCQGGVYCGHGVCGGGEPFGSACRQDTDCQAGLVCPSGTCAHAAYPGDACDGTTTVCVLSLCRNGTCVDHAKVGKACGAGTDCATGVCYQGACADTSVCPVP
jgi:hypothetical protein